VRWPFGTDFVWLPLAIALYCAMAAMWMIPDRRLERTG